MSNLPFQDTMSEQYVHWFRNSAPYINTHRGKTFVLLFGGEAVNHENFHNIVHDIALLHSLGIRLVLVHGARPQIDENLTEYGLTTPFQNGLRVTTRESLRCVMDAVGSIRLEIEALLSMGLANSPMFGAKIDAVSGNFITARPYGVRDGVDFCLTGEVRSVAVAEIYKLSQNDALQQELAESPYCDPRPNRLLHYRRSIQSARRRCGSQCCCRAQGR